jgi:hypothetical protein
MAVTITLLKFVLGALIVVLAFLDVDQQPFMVIVGLVLMGVLTAEQFYDWFPTRTEPHPKADGDADDR